MSKPRDKIEMFGLSRVPTNPVSMLDRIRSLEAEVAKLRPKRRHDPELAGLYPQKSGGVSVYLLPVGSGIKDRAALYVGIARDMTCAKAMQKQARAILLRAVADPNWARMVLLKVEWKATDADVVVVRHSFAEQPFGTAIQLAEDTEATPTEPDAIVEGTP